MSTGAPGPMAAEDPEADDPDAKDPDAEIGTAFLVCGPYDNVGNQDAVQAAIIVTGDSSRIGSPPTGELTLMPSRAGSEPRGCML